MVPDTWFVIHSYIGPDVCLHIPVGLLWKRGIIVAVDAATVIATVLWVPYRAAEMLHSDHRQSLARHSCHSENALQFS